MKSGHRVLKKKFLLLCISLLISILAGEFLLRAFDHPSKLVSGWGWEDSPRHKLAKFENDSTNDLGLRGQRFFYDDDDYVVVLLGDSQVEAATSSPERMPERLLEKYLAIRMGRPVKVFSLAATGWGQDQQLIALEEYYKKYRADLVLAWITLHNDAWENAFPDRSTSRRAGHLKPTYLLKNDKLEGPFYKSDFFYSNSALIQLAVMSLANRKGESMEDVVLKDWLKKIPKPHGPDSEVASSDCARLPIADWIKFGEAIYDQTIDLNDKGYILETNEDVLSSRSHFTIYIDESLYTERDKYIIKLTRKLFERIKKVASSHHSKFQAFDIERVVYQPLLALKMCIQTKGKPKSARLLNFGDLPRFVPDKNYLRIKLKGTRKELVVGKKDLHLGDFGNDQAMKKIAELIQLQ